MPPWVLRFSTDLPHLFSLQNTRMWGSSEDPESGDTASPIPTGSPQCWLHIPWEQEAFFGRSVLKLCPSSGHRGYCHKAWEDPTRARWGALMAAAPHGHHPAFRLHKFLLEHPAVSHISSQRWPLCDIQQRSAGKISSPPNTHESNYFSRFLVCFQ